MATDTVIDLDRKIENLGILLRELERVIVCFSGGVDSSYLLAEAVGVLGAGAVALTAVSPSLTAEEGEDARLLARDLGARHLLVETFEVDDPRYAANPINRCYFCKTEVYGKAIEEARRLDIRWVFASIVFAITMTQRASKWVRRRSLASMSWRSGERSSPNS